jgi:hypothetical protein
MRWYGRRVTAHFARAFAEEAETAFSEAESPNPEPVAAAG